MIKRAFDFCAALAGLLVSSPVLLIVLIAVWLQDFRSPFYLGERVGRDFKPFKMVKVRSMVEGADKSGVESTGSNDMRITAVGRFVRKWKIDEISQLWNVLVGEMSIVGPRPNTFRGVEVYSSAEKGLLSVRPGITDMSSIVFSDEGEILADSEDPDADYDILIRPWKSRLGLLYVTQTSIWLDIRLVWLTLVAIVKKHAALHQLSGILRSMAAPPELIEVALRDRPLQEFKGRIP